MFADVLVAVLIALVGLLFLMAGYRFFLLLLPLWGFVAGFWAGAAAMTALFGTGFLATALSWLAAILVGLACAALSYLFYWAAIIIFTLSVGASIGSGIMAEWGLDSRLLTIGMTLFWALALVALVLVVNLPKLLIVCISAFAGATALIAAFLLLFDQIQRSDLYHGATKEIIGQSYVWPLVWLILTMIGVMVQTYSTTNFTIETPTPPLSAEA